MNRFLLFQFLKDKLIRFRPFKVAGNVSLEELLKKNPRVALEDYRKNVTEMINFAREQGMQSLLVSVPNNPAASYFINVPHANPEVNALVKQGEQAFKEGRYAEALSILGQAEGLAKTYYRVYYWQGRVYQQTEPEKSIEKFEAALEYHPFPERQKPSYNKTLLEIARDMDVPMIDLYELIKNSSAGLERVYMDGAHPSFEGNQLIAGLIAEAIIDRFSPFTRR